MTWAKIKLGDPNITENPKEEREKEMEKTISSICL